MAIETSGARRAPGPTVRSRRAFSWTRGFALLALVVVAGAGGGCSDDEAPVFVLGLDGRTMGTTWSARITVVSPADETLIRRTIETELERVNAEMSTYLPGSEITRFNASGSTAPMPVSPGFATTLQVALEVARASGGALDPTVGPAVELWGFGPAGRRDELPTEDEIAAARARIGWERIGVTLAPPTASKADPDLAIDLSAVAKGHGADRVGAALDGIGLTSWFVEIGGEVRVQGRKPGGERWTIGLERPSEGRRQIATIVSPDAGAVASSGDYRNLFEKAGKRYAHTIDPRTARPVTHDLAGVSVHAATCAEADAWATALMVLGPDEGYDRAVENGLAALFFVRRDDALAERRTPAFEALFGTD